MPRIAIIISSTRETRFADKPTEWFTRFAKGRTDLDFEVVDLRDFPLPFFNEVASNAYVPSQNDVAQRWQQKVAEFDGYVIITAEYNRGPTAVLKNALDYSYVEWNRKPIAFVGYGSVGAARAIAPYRRRASAGSNSYRRTYSRCGLFCRMAAGQGPERTDAPRAWRSGHAGGTGLVDECSQDGPRQHLGNNVPTHLIRPLIVSRREHGECAIRRFEGRTDLNFIVCAFRGTQ